MRLTGNHRSGDSRTCRRHPWFPLAAVTSLLVLGGAGCATTEHAGPALTGNLLVDGPAAIAQGPAKDRVLWQYRTSLACLRQGNFAQGKAYLDEALSSIGGAFGPDRAAKQARGYFHGEAKKTFLGEPYERSMAYIYRGMLYWMDGEPDNARACFRSAEIADSDTENREYAGDWVLPDYLDGYATAKLGGDGSDAYKRASAAAKGVTLPPYNPKANVLFFIEFGPGPQKIGAGEYGEQLRFMVPTPPVRSAELKFAKFNIPVAPTDDVGFQATTRGGRVMDHILGNKAVFKSTTDTLGDAALIGGLSTAVISRDQTAQQVGIGLALAGVLSKAISAATVPAADTRTWDNLPQYLSFASIQLPPGEQTVTVEFLDASGRPQPNLTKQLKIQVPADGKDKVVFISDQSITPQNI